MNLIVTSPLSGEASSSHQLQHFLIDIDLPYIPRDGKSLAQLQQENAADGVVVWKLTGPILQIGDQQFFFHPSMAKVRIGVFRKSGQTDALVRACALKEGDHFLDCTVGLGADAIVAAYFSKTQVIGLESSRVVAAMVKWGMCCFNSSDSWLNESIQRIEVINADHNKYLQQLGDRSVDVVYFDPMFRNPLLKSQALSPLRGLADHRPLEIETIEHACRVARSRVVIKERRHGEEFKRLGIKTIQSGSGSKLAYGVINIS